MKFRIRPSILTGFAAMGVLVVIVAVAAIFYAGRMQRNTRRIIEENVSSLKAAEELEIALLDMKGLTSNYILRREQRWLDQFSLKKAAFLYWLQEAQNRATSSREAEIVAGIDALFADYMAVHDRIVAAARGGDTAGAYELLTLELLPYFDQIYAKCEELLTINEHLMLDAGAVVAADFYQMNLLITGIGIAGILSGLGIGLWMSRKILYPIHNLVLRLRGVAQNDLVRRVEVDDLSELEHLNEYVHQLIAQVGEVNRDLELNQEMLMRTEKLAALGKMAAGLAHEIRNPITAVKMLLHSAQEEPLDTEQLRQDLSVIIAEIDRVEKILQDFLAFARPSDPQFAEWNLDELIGQTLRLLSAQLKGKQIQLEKQCPPALQIHADGEQMQQVLVNVLLNSIQAVSEGGKITIHCREMQAFGNRPAVEIVVADNGPGVPPDLMGQIFDPFVTAKEDGTGLGLSIAAQIVHNHGGEIFADNLPGGGAQFTIRLPRKREAL
ncbi:MAG: ATP-binding protein [candidate division KSB1 bacterium]|nr:ATP-binding protein [candidate division KSB1 bacterium]MDZ7347208.1 ATP-binding protein [candidate division KSB1 bacterium]